MKKISKPIPVESVFDLRTDSQMWYNIPGYNGYEISNQGYIRSMKNFRRYPYGMLIRPIKDKKGNNYFELSDDFNHRKKLSIQEIWNLAMNNPYKNNSYPRSTWITDSRSRNPLAFSHSRTDSKPIKQETYSYVEFPIIKDIDNDIQIRNFKSPIYFIDEKGEKYV